MVRTPQGKLLRFQCDTGMCHGFPYLDLSLSEAANLEGYLHAPIMLEKCGGYTKREAEIEKAIFVSKKQIQVGLPSDHDFLKIVSGNCIKNVNFTLQDI